MGLEVADLFATLGLKPDEESWRKGDKLIESVKHGLEAFAGIEAVKKVGEMVDRVVQAAQGTENLSQKVGVTTGAIQELGYAAYQSDATVEDMQVSLQHLARGMEELRTKGTGPAADAFRSLGVSAAEVKNKSPDEVLMALADHFRALPDGARKTAAAMDLFGRSGTTLIPLLNRGSAGIAELRQEAEKLGVVIDEDGIKKASEFEDSQKRLKATLTGLRNEAVIALLPALQEMVQGIVEWAQANREIIKSGIEAVVKGVMLAMQALGAAIKVVVGLIEFLSEHAMVARSVLIALGLILGAIAVEATAAWLAMAAPVVAAVAGVAAVILIFQDFLKALLDGKGVIATVFGFIADKVKGALRSIKGAFEDIGHFFASIASAVKNAFVAVIDWITDKIDWAWSQVKKVAHAITHPRQALGAAVDYFTGGPDEPGSPENSISGALPASASASRIVPSGSSAPVVTVDAPADITINASGTDPQGVVDIANKQIAKHHDRVWRQVSAATGAGDEP